MVECPRSPGAGRASCRNRRVRGRVGEAASGTRRPRRRPDECDLHHRRSRQRQRPTRHETRRPTTRSTARRATLIGQPRPVRLRERHAPRRTRLLPRRTDLHIGTEGTHARTGGKRGTTLDDAELGRERPVPSRDHPDCPRRRTNPPFVAPLTVTPGTVRSAAERSGDVLADRPTPSWPISRCVDDPASSSWAPCRDLLSTRTTLLLVRPCLKLRRRSARHPTIPMNGPTTHDPVQGRVVRAPPMIAAPTPATRVSPTIPQRQRGWRASVPSLTRCGRSGRTRRWPLRRSA